MPVCSLVLTEQNKCDCYIFIIYCDAHVLGIFVIVILLGISVIVNTVIFQKLYFYCQCVNVFSLFINVLLMSFMWIKYEPVWHSG